MNRNCKFNFITYIAMISKFLGKLKSILFKSAVSTETPLKKEKKPTKSAKSSKTKTKIKTKTKTKTNQKHNKNHILIYYLLNK